MACTRFNSFQRSRITPQDPQSLHAGGSVNADDLAVHPLAIIRGKEAQHAGNVNRQADTVVGAPGGSVLVDLLVGELVASGNVFLCFSSVQGHHFD
jgi:hypothetical protein